MQDFSEEFEEAKQVQAALVSLEFPEDPRFAIQSVYLPFTEVSGDFFSVQKGPEESLFLLFGDVSGHGTGAAMVGAMVVVSFRNAVRSAHSPLSVLEYIAQDLKPLVLSHFVSCICVQINFQKKLLTLANAGHPHPVLLGKGKPLQKIIAKGVPLFSIEGFPYTQSTLEFGPMDALFCYSDGIYEIRSEEGESLGLERFHGVVTSEWEAGAEVSDFVFRVVAESMGHSDLRIQDDVTLLGLQFL